jgi:hypothetical protein
MQDSVVEIRYASLAVEYRPPSTVLSTSLCAALFLLRQARRLAENANCEVWDFAVELEELRRTGVSIVEIRWLLVRGFAQQAWELPPLCNGRRRFDKANSWTLRPNSCFVMTDAGLPVVRGLADGPTTQRHLRKSPSALALEKPARSSVRRRNGFAVAPAPFYDGLRNEFFWGETLVKRFRSPAPNQQGVLAAFQASSWPDRIDDPLPETDGLCPRRRLSETIRALNHHQTQFVIRFCGDGSGRGVLWECVS